jgi:diaminopimelate epimerase
MGVLKFSKLVGAGNDFIFINAEDWPKHLDPKKVAPQICDRYFGVGADGLAIITCLNQGELSWDFYNNDGSNAEMCGNAARCVFSYAAKVWGWKQASLKTSAGMVHGQFISDEQCQVSWSIPLSAGQFRDVTLSSSTRANNKDDSEVSGFFVDTGVPHFVIDQDKYSLSQDQLLQLQRHPDFGPRGTNVTLTSKANGERCTQTKSFERGVGDFTLACGTGVIATALFWGANTSNQEFLVQAPGGLMTVRFQRDDDVVELTGPAQFVFSGQLEL